MPSSLRSRICRRQLVQLGHDAQRLGGREVVPGRVVAARHGVLPVPARGVAGEDVADAAAQQVRRRLAHEVEVDEDHLRDGVGRVVHAGLVADRHHVREAGVHRWQAGHLPERHAAPPVEPLGSVHGGATADAQDRALPAASPTSPSR